VAELPLDDAASADLERPFRAAGGVAVPTLVLAALVLGAGTVSATLAVRGVLPLAVAIPFHTLLAYVAFTPAHEAGHGNIAGANARYRWLESSVGWVMSTVFAVPYSMLRYLHLLHHSHTNDPEKDPDHRVRGSGVPTVLFRCYTVQLGYLRVMSRKLGEGAPGARAARRGLWIHTAALALLYAAGFHFGFVRWLLLLWSLPAALAQGLLALVFDWLPHHPHRSQERYRDTRVILGPGLETLLLGQNDHLVHHL
jgi:beta-carotene hydroxylase